MPNAILRVGPYANGLRSGSSSLQFYSKEEGIEQSEKSVNVSNTHWPNADWRSVFVADYIRYDPPNEDESIVVEKGYVGLNGASGSKEGLPTVFTAEWPSDGLGTNPFLGGGFFYQATELFKLKLKYKFWNGFSVIRIRIVGEKIGTSSGSSPTQFLSHTIEPANGGGSFPGPNIDDEYEIELPASALGQITILMDGEGLDAIAGTEWTLEFTTVS
tara:strand:- start:59 stop:706 length:648 start_codon:yes stop_codon:yes gene_type:complete